MDFLVRRARKADFPKIRALDVLVEGVRIADGEHTWREWTKYAGVWVAEKGKLLGVIVVFPTTQGSFYLHKIFVHPRFQRHGIGRLLLKHALSALKGKRVSLTVNPENPAALHLYKKHGFRVKKLDRSYYRKNEPRYLMEK